MVKTRTRLFLALLVLFGLGLYQMMRWILDDVRPHFLETMEESMVDMATLLAAQVSSEAADGLIPLDGLRAAFDAAGKRRFAAKIYAMNKTRINLQVYVTDHKGVVLFDSNGGRAEGQDYSRWNDVYRTLNGQYGARATTLDPANPRSELLYVASPILAGDKTIGVLSVCKPTDSVRLFMEIARRDLLLLGAVSALTLVLIAVMTSRWITWPIDRLTGYVQAIRDGKRGSLPRLGRSEIGVLGHAFEEMRVALEGKQYVEDYVQTLTHQMKSPLSAIQGAAELLEEDMPAEQRRHFLENIRSESSRLRDLVDRMLQLSALENRRQLNDTAPICLSDLVREALQTLKPGFDRKRLTVRLAGTVDLVVPCERFLVSQALVNLLENAVDFSNDGGQIEVSLNRTEAHVTITVADEGCGIPEYALDKVFDRFYSLVRPGTGKKSSGLGLAFAREVAVLHGGWATLENRAQGGAIATLALGTGTLSANA